MSSRNRFRLGPRAQPWLGGHMAFAVLVLLVAGAFAAYAQAPSAGTTIGNQATATFTDISGTTRDATSNLVQTIVQQVASLTLTAHGAKTAAPGNQVVYPHILTNTGNGADSFTLSLVNAGGDDFDMNGIAIYADANQDGLPDNFTDLNGTTVNLAEGGEFHFVVAGTVPGTATDNQTSGLTVTATSVFDGGQTANNTDTTTITGDAVINVTKSIDTQSGTAGSGPYTYTLTYINAGNNTATDATLTDAIPSGMTYVANSARWSVTGTTVLTDADAGDAQGTAPDTIVYDFGVTTGGTLTAVLNQIEAGESGTLTFQITVDASAVPGIVNNTANVSYDDGSGTNIGPDPTNTVAFTVVPTRTVNATDNGSNTDDDGSVDDIVTETAVPQGSTANFDNVIENTGNATDTFNITVSGSTFPAGTTFQLFQSDGATPLVDTNGDSTSDTGPIAPGGSTHIFVRAILPANASGAGPYNVTKTATSVYDAAVMDSVTDRLGAILANTVDITNDTSVNGGAAAGDGLGAGPEGAAIRTNPAGAGTTTTFDLFINNTGQAADNYDLAASTDNTFAAITLPTGWTVAFYLDDGDGLRNADDALITNTGNIAAGSEARIFADVGVPAGFAAGTSSLFFRALAPSTGATDIIHDAVTVSTAREITIIPNYSGQAFPSGVVVYPHTINNPGNVDENTGPSTVTIDVGNSVTGFTTVVYYDSNGNGVVDVGADPVVAANGTPGPLPVTLSAGGSLPLLARVSAPASATIGTVDIASLTATTTGDINAVSAPPAVVATDNTTIISGDVFLQKTQAPDADCNGTADTAFSINLMNANPGSCICYEITATNTGSIQASSIVINDMTPAFTTLSVTPTTTVGSIGSTPALGGAGAIAANVGTLAQLQTVVVSFCVQIDQ